MKYPMGIFEDVPLRREVFIPCNFAVMEIEEDAQISIILGCPLLATMGAMIDVKH